MILNVCLKDNKMVDENKCNNCFDRNCKHAGENTTKERLENYDLINNRRA